MDLEQACGEMVSQCSMNCWPTAVASPLALMAMRLAAVRCRRICHTHVIFGAILYFISTMVAVAREVRNAGSVFVVNLFLGWTVIGWVIARL